MIFAPAVCAFSPRQLNGICLWLDASDSASITKAYANLAQTATGTISTNTITASATVVNQLDVGTKVRLSGTDVYTVSAVSTVTITTVETLTNNYIAAVMAAEGVSQWNDKSGAANHATQATASIQPGYKYANRNGRDTIWFNGVLKRMEYTNVGLNTINSATIFTVWNVDNTTSGNDSLLCFGTGTQGRLEVAAPSGGSVILSPQGSLGIKADSTTFITITTDAWHYMDLKTDGSNIAVRNDGSSTYSNTQAAAWATGAGNYGLGGSTTPNRQIRCTVAEIIICKSALPTAAITATTNYLKTKWGF